MSVKPSLVKKNNRFESGTQLLKPHGVTAAHESLKFLVLVRIQMRLLRPQNIDSDVIDWYSIKVRACRAVGIWNVGKCWLVAVVWKTIEVVNSLRRFDSCAFRVGEVAESGLMRQF